MNSPAAALTWEIWRRHHKRLLGIMLLLLAFALFYPSLCARVGVRLDVPDALDELGRTFSQQMEHASSLARIVQILCVLFLLLGPLTCMGVSLLCVIWIFTLAQSDLKRGFAFPARLFTLPVSTTCLASWLLAVGATTVIGLYLGWTRLVHLPHISVFEGYSNCLAWVALLTVSQAILWALDAFPVARVLLLTAALCGLGLLAGPSVHDYPLLERNRLVLMSVLLLTGCGVAYVGLGKIRHGSWQRWTWKWRLAPATAGSKLKRLSAFRSQAQAQFWFEWRRQARKLVLCVCALSGVPLLIHVIYYGIANPGPLSADSTLVLGVYLLAVPLFIHFFQGISPERELPQFIATRPLANGEILMAKLRAAALSTVLAWIVTLPMLALVALLGDVPAAIERAPFLSQNLPLLRPLLPVMLLGLMFLTWRFVAADLCFGFAGKSWVAGVAVFKIYGLMALGGVLVYLAHDSKFEQTLFRFLPVVLASLVGLKFFLAQWAFRISLKRQLLTRAAMIGYLAAWTLLAVAFLVPTVVMYHRQSWILSLALGIILLLPLARIGFCPIALNLGRHR
jgi:hypothetical protein